MMRKCYCNQCGVEAPEFRYCTFCDWCGRPIPLEPGFYESTIARIPLPEPEFRAKAEAIHAPPRYRPLMLLQAQRTDDRGYPAGDLDICVDCLLAELQRAKEQRSNLAGDRNCEHCGEFVPPGYALFAHDGKWLCGRCIRKARAEGEDKA